MFDPSEIGSIKRPSNRKLKEEGLPLDDDGKNMSAIWYDKKMPYAPKPGVAENNRKRTGAKGGNWKGGHASGDNRQAYLTMKAREYRHAKNGPPSRGPYAD
jgi:hypothetical protein